MKENKNDQDMIKQLEEKLYKAVNKRNHKNVKKREGSEIAFKLLSDLIAGIMVGGFVCKYLDY